MTLDSVHEPPRNAKGEPVNERGQRICGAKTRTGYCKKYPKADRTRCHKHGGASLRGIAHPGYKGKGYSRYTPRQMNEAFEHAKADPDILDVKPDMQLIQARIMTLLENANIGGNAQLWNEAQARWKAYERAIARGDVPAMQEALSGVGEILKRGASGAAAWSEITGLIEQRRRLAETETRRLVAMHRVVTQEQLDLLMSHVVVAIKENVTDRKALQAISERLAMVLGGVSTGGEGEVIDV